MPISLQMIVIKETEKLIQIIFMTANAVISFLQKQRISFRHISGRIGQENGRAGADDAQSTGRHCLSCGVHADARESSAAAYGDGQCRSGV